MNIELIISCFLFAIAFILLGYKLGCNNQKRFFNNVIENIITHLEETVNKNKNDINQYEEKVKNKTITDEEFEMVKEKIKETAYYAGIEDFLIKLKEKM